MSQQPDFSRNLSLELVRVTEAAALLAGRWMGRGEKEAADQAAVDAMRQVLDTIEMEGEVVIGEGEKDHAPMLYYGERVGRAESPKVDIAVDPVDGTRLLALGMPNSICVLAIAERGAMYKWEHISYMEKIAVGPDARGTIDLNSSVAENLARVAEAKKRKIDDLTVVILDRPRHEQLIADVRDAGARLKLITDGDVAGALMAAMQGTGIDVLMGIGGSPEAVIGACALKCVGGDMQCRLFPRNDDERAIAEQNSIDLARIYGIDDLVGGDDVFFAATGITDGELLDGVRYGAEGATTHSLVMRAVTGTVRYVHSTHRRQKLEMIRHMPLD
ncbi:MAG TPA: class II fructose-bisphosphatase [Thermomicrobiales bacterium]|nr:class II fructose-bisphosphatase [Thermomicrobiales bacterium]